MKNYIKQFRKKTGMTQEQMAGLLGVSRSSITHTENGNRNISLPLEFLSELDGALNKISSADILSADTKVRAELNEFNMSLKIKAKKLTKEIRYQEALLKRMQEEFEKGKALYKLLHIIKLKQSDKNYTRVKLWKEYTALTAETIYKNNNEAKQLRLHLNILKLKAEHTVYQNLIMGSTKKKIKNVPLKGLSERKLLLSA